MPATVAAEPSAAPVVRLSRRARAVRLGVAGAVVAVLLYGSTRGTDDMFPLGPMVQFAFAVDLDGEIRASYVEALTTEGRIVRVPLNPRGVGYGRAELEGRIPSFTARPEMLQAIAVAQRRLHPDQPQYRHLWLRQTITDLEDGVAVATTTRLVAEWEVQP
ncbi:MAG: hypothetical protein M3Q27_10995 [Actinomycetota bacterium]|nr:hypothetical protein [Actinomycetota bacterium]